MFGLVAAGALALGAMAGSGHDGRPAFAGPATVIDGDTIRIGITRIRLFGIDAPESKQFCKNAEGAAYPCGKRATAHLESIADGSHVECTPAQGNHDRYGRVVASCFVSPRSWGWKTLTRIDLSEEMVRAGWAKDYSRYSRGRYASIEDEATKAKRGMWAGTFENPQQFRAEHRGR